MSRNSDSTHRPVRRQLLQAGAAAAGLTVLACAGASTQANTAAKQGQSDDAHGEAEVTPGEDLMQEHGVLERVIIVYDAAALRMERGEQLEPTLITKAAGVIRRFVEDYHERTEEKEVFPRLQAAGRETTLVATLLRQHERGRQLTDEILRRATSGGSQELARALRSFGQMYRAHAAREDTVIFPAFRGLLSRSDYAELGERFEEREHELLGERGFEQAVTEVASLEAALGIADLASYTPP